jgi:glycosyltransferase involved in cell wall biosynthesis
VTVETKDRIRVQFVLPTLYGGGAERTMLNLLNNLDRERFQPSLVLFQREGQYLSLVRDDVDVIAVNRRTRNAVLPLAREIRRLRPHIVFSTLLHTNVVAVAARMLSLSPALSIVRETNNQTAAGRSHVGLEGRAVRWAYRRAHRVICLSAGVADDVQMRNGLRAGQTPVVYNPVDLENIQSMAKAVLPAGVPYPSPGRFNVLAAGRLMPQKGFDLLITGLASVRGLDWQLTILGEGIERQALENLAGEMGVSDRVSFQGFQSNPYAWMARADLFVLSSRWEGFGHVIVEAMASGVPVLSTRCPSGPDEIITDGVDGTLCAISAEDIGAKIAGLAGSVEVRRRHAVAGHVTAKRFDVHSITTQYSELFVEALAERRSAQRDSVAL